ncbi:Tail fiber assembly domain protein [Pseudomonas caricapapayae]|uniref:Tail fiber assembly domain protein n=1 Tax=Pseudomonas caricapapayae TaxID=46678 RepID=A0A3M6FCW9_9PSED|nr:MULTISPECIES: phage tail protein [Pseudomonas]MCJ2374873.1 tail fiber assembly protein [Pseudomonas sp. RGM 3321]RMV78505.1 Tail fiber assembly domain protein [Pseudomonas caricapapayae]
MSTILSARNPYWSSQARTTIELMVAFEGLVETHGELPFTASPHDPEPHGVELYERALAGEFGPVQDTPIELVRVQVMCIRGDRSAAATARIDELMTEYQTVQDAVALKMATDEQLKALPAVEAELNAQRVYRVKLAQLDTLPGYPLDFEWPTPPANPFVYEPPESEGSAQDAADDEAPKT